MFHRVSSPTTPLLFLGIFIGSLALPHTAAKAQSNASTPSRDLGLHPSEEPQAQDALDLFQGILDTLNARQRLSQAPPQQPKPATFFGKIESYLRENNNQWYVILTKLALAAALGLIVALVYRASYTGKRKKYSPSMMQSQLLLCIAGSLIWILVGNFLVRAFGLAGMVGLIRYRTRVRDPKDNVMVFISMAIGMACGLAQVTVAIVSTGFVCFVLFAAYEFRLGKKKKKKKPKAEEPAPTATNPD